MSNDYNKINKVLDKMTDDKKKNIRILKKYFNLDNGRIGQEIEKIYKLTFDGSSIKDSNILLLDALIEYSKSVELLHLIDFYEILCKTINCDVIGEACKKVLEIIIKNNININDSLYKYTGNKHKCLFYSISVDCLSLYIDLIYELLKKAGYNIFSVYDDYVRMDDYLKTHKEERETQRLSGRIESYKKKNNQARLEFLEKYEEERQEILSLSNEEILKRVKKEFPEFYREDLSVYEYIHKVSRTLLFEYVGIYIDEEYSLRIIEALLDSGIDPNKRDLCGNTFIEVAFMTRNHNKQYIYKLLENAIKYGYDVNSVDFDKNTIMHNIIEGCKYKFNDISDIYQLLLNNGFDSLAKNSYNKTIYDLIIESEYEYNDSSEIIKLYNNYVHNNVNEDIKYLYQFRKYLFINNKNLINKDIKFNKNKLNFITGKQGLGKRDNLINLYLSDNVSSIYITKEDILNECEFISDYKAKILNIIRLCSFNNISLYIENFDDIISNLKDIDKNEILMIIELYHQKYNLKLNTTVDDKTIIDDPVIKDVVNEVKLNEPTLEEMELFIINTLHDYEIKYNKRVDNFTLIEEIAKILINNIENSDEISNLKVFYDFINNLFTNCSSDIILINDIISSLYNLENIKDNCKLTIIKELNNINNNKDYNNAVKRIKKKF